MLSAQGLKSDGLVLALLAVDLLLLVSLRGVDMQTPWAFWCLLLVLGPAFVEGVRRWRERALLGVAPQLLGLIWLCFVDQFAAFPVESLAQTGLVSHALLLAIVAARTWSPTGRTLMLLLISLPALGYAVWAGWGEQYVSPELRGTRDPNNVAISASLGVLALLAWLRVRAEGGWGAGATGGGSPELPPKGWWQGHGSGLWAGVLLCAGAAFVISGLLGARAASFILLLALALRLLTERNSVVAAWFVAAVFGFLLATMVSLSGSMATTTTLAQEEALSALEVAKVQRLPIIAVATELLRSAPIHGYGLLSFHYLFSMQREPKFLGTSMVHNDYLQFGLELGWPALLALCALGALLLRDWVRASFATLSGRHCAAYTSTGWLALALLGVWGHALVNFPFYDGFVLAQIAVLTLFVRTTSLPSPVRLGDAGRSVVDANMFGLIARKAAIIRGLGMRLAAMGGAAIGMAAMGVVVLVTVRMALLSLAFVLFFRYPVLPGVTLDSPSPAVISRVASRLEGQGFLGGLPAFALGEQFSRIWAAEGRRDDELALAARKYFKQAWGAEPWVAEYSIQYARMLRETGVPLAVRLELLERALERNKGNSRLYLSLVAHWLQARDMEGAVAVVERWLPWCKYGQTHSQERADLLGLAQLLSSGTARKAYDRCTKRLALRGIKPNAPEEVLARFRPQTE